MKKLIVLLAGLTIASIAYADSTDDGTGYILGFDVGSADISYKPNGYSSYIAGYTAPATSISHKQGFAYDAYLGYRLYREFGWQVGYMGFSNAQFNYAGTPASVKVKRSDYDFLMRGDYPFSAAVSVFAKLGVARVNSRFETGIGQDTNISAWTPVYGVGTSYNLTDHTGINAQWLHVQQVNQNAHLDSISADVPATDLFSLGMVYRF